MATLILTAVGTAIGGPIGGSIGALIGQQADRAIFGGGTREGPRLKELSVTTSSYGQPMPRHFGRMRVAGTVIWSTELIETSSKQGGGKGKPSTKTYSYSASFAVALASTQIDRIGRIWADGNLLRGTNGDLKVGGAMRAYLGTGDSPVDPLIAADRGSTSPAFRDCAYVVFESLSLGDFGNRIPALTFEIFAPSDDTVSLGQLVPQSASVTGQVLLKNARGFSDEGGAVGSSLAAIDRIFPITCVTTAEGLSLSSADAVPDNVLTLPEQLSTRDSDDADERTKQRGDTLGREPLALRYYDEDRDYQPGVQRALGQRPDGREAMLDLPAAMNSDGARDLANNNAHRSRWHDEYVVWRVGEIDPQIGPGNVVRVPGANGFWLIKSWEWFNRGIELGLERIAPELGAVVGGDAGVANPPTDVEYSPTLISAFEVPSDGTSNPSNPVLFASASSTGSGWRGAALFVEQGASLSDIGAVDRNRATMGALASSLGISGSAMLETAASMIVDLWTEGLGFDSSDPTGLATGANRVLIGGEVIQFLKASPIGANRWKLSGLLRGRAGTEDVAARGHEAGSSVVLLNEALTALDPAQVPSAIGTRIAAIGQGDIEPVFAELNNVGLSRRPPMPVHPRKTELADGSWELCWTRRARGHWRWHENAEVPLVEEQESYTVGYGPCDAPFAFWSVAEPQFTISSAEKSSLLLDYGPASFWVRHVGTFGISSPLLIATIS